MVYDNITLKTFVEINRTGNYSLLGYARDAEKEWEKIVAQNVRANGSFELINYKSELIKLNKFRADYILVKAALTKLSFVVDNDAIALLRSKGYRIADANATAYNRSILDAIQASNNLLSKIESKRIAIDKIAAFNRGESVGFQELLAALSIAIGFNVDENVKLSWFNAAKKTLKQKNNGGRKRN